MISALPAVPLSVGAHRVVRGVRVEHLCGDPSLSREQDRVLMLRICRTALAALQTSVEDPTLFDPASTSAEAVHATA